MVKRWQPTSDGGMEEIPERPLFDIGEYVLAADYDALAARIRELEARYRMLQRWWLLSDGEPDDQDFDTLDRQLDDAIAKDRGDEHG